VSALEVVGEGGVRIVGDDRGDPTATPVLLLHGGGQTRHSWQGTAEALADRGWRAITLDARGHGESDWAPEGDYRLWSFASDVKAAVDHVGERPFVVGASLGGSTALLLAGEVAPGLARGVVLVDIIPRMEQAGAERVMSFMHDNAASGFASLEEVADAVAAYNPHRPRPDDVSGLRKNVREIDGRWYWHWDPAFLSEGARRRAPTEVLHVERLEACVQAILDRGTPMLLVRGRSSDLVSEEGARDFRERFPAVEFVDVSGAGHMVAGDRNDAFTSAVVDFLDRHR
jgi:peroxiredoxin